MKARFLFATLTLLLLLSATQAIISTAGSPPLHRLSIQAQPNLDPNAPPASDCTQAERAADACLRAQPVDQAPQGPADTLPIVDTFSTYDWPRGLAWDGANLWYADASNDRVYKLDPDTGSELDSFATPLGNPHGLTWDGTYLWLVNNDFTGDDDLIYKLETDGTLVETFDAPGPRPTGLAWDGDSAGGPYLWVADWDDDLIYKTDPNNLLAVVDSFAAPASAPRGLAWDGQFLWVNKGNSANPDTIWKLDPAQNGAVVTTYEAPGPDSNFPTGLAWNSDSAGGPYLYHSDEDSDLIYKLAISVSEPDIQVSPPSFSHTLPPNTIFTDTLTVSNVGTGTLSFQIRERPGGFTPTLTVHLTAQPASPTPQSPSPELAAAERQSLSIFVHDKPLPGSQIDHPLTPWADVELLLDDGTQENSLVICDTDSQTEFHVVLFNHFDANLVPSFPFTLERIDIRENTHNLQGNEIQLLVYSDPDGGDFTNASLLHSEIVTVQTQNGWNAYTLTTPITLSESADILLGFSTYYADGGVPWPFQDRYPYPMDTTSPQSRSYLAWMGNPSDPVDVADLSSFVNLVETQDIGYPANWLVRGYGSLPPAADVPWLWENPISGTLTASDSLTVDVVFDTHGLAAGSYRADLVIDSNDPDENPLLVPVHLTVISGCVPIDGLRFEVDPAAPVVGQPVTLSASVAAGTPPITYTWRLDDGAQASGQTVSYTFPVSNSFATHQVILTAANTCPSQQTVRGSVISLLPMTAFVNQPWDWVEGRTTAGATVQASLIRGGAPYPTTQTVADSAGWFALHFREGGEPLDILEGDAVVLSGGDLDERIDVITIQGNIDVAADTVSGQMSGGSFPAAGVVGIGRAADSLFVTQAITIAADGSYSADFQVDILDGYLAKVWYSNPDGNQVRKILYSDGLDVRALATGDLVEGVTVPGSTVQILLRDSDGNVKGTATATADRTGHYRTQIPGDTAPVDILIGDQVSASSLGLTQSLDVDVHQVSLFNPENDTVHGQLSGGAFPAAGRVELWHASTDTWYYRDVQIDAAGNYTADFGGLVDVQVADRIRVWYIDPNGNQIASVNSSLEFGASVTRDVIWGFTAPNTSVEIAVLDSAGGDVLGSATVVADSDGFFETPIEDPAPLDIVAGQQVSVTANQLHSNFAIDPLRVRVSLGEQSVSIEGPPNAVFHLQAQRSGDSTWVEVAADATGHAQVDLNGGYDLQGGDRLDLVSYLIPEGHVIHHMFSAYERVFLPIILKNF